ncbi:uncharacterized protein TNCV_1996071 [Trichonephila clavipes]|uniref:Uncharacterized protein n=1 Tax=Trichonephila clavipes TaxID=2585209 RepID=A0A8X6RLT8_TRICX|nr:uncharacterized protein TNCV_1996071 [Trichonephila clavipes]
MDEILTTARNLELEVNEDDIEELIMGHEDELTIEELQEIFNEEHQETQRNVSPSGQEEDERGRMPTFSIKDLLKNDEAHFWLNGYVNKQNCCIWREANLQVYVETPLHPEKLTFWCALWAGGILLQKR